VPNRKSSSLFQNCTRTRPDARRSP